MNIGFGQFGDDLSRFVNGRFLYISKFQRRPMAKPIAHYAKKVGGRNKVIIAADKSGGYSVKEIMQYFELGTSTISDTVNGRKSQT